MKLCLNGSPNMLKKILHIDDDSVMRLMVAKSLERCKHDFETISVATAEEFFVHLSVFQPDLLLLDMTMPIITGPEILTQIRRNGNKTPAIFMTGNEGLIIENKNALEPILGIIQKPFSPTHLGDDLMALWKNKV